MIGRGAARDTKKENLDFGRIGHVTTLLKLVDVHDGTLCIVYTDKYFYNIVHIETLLHFETWESIINQNPRRETSIFVLVILPGKYLERELHSSANAQCWDTGF